MKHSNLITSIIFASVMLPASAFGLASFSEAVAEKSAPTLEVVSFENEGILTIAPRREGLDEEAGIIRVSTRERDLWGGETYNPTGGYIPVSPEPTINWYEEAYLDRERAVERAPREIEVVVEEEEEEDTNDNSSGRSSSRRTRSNGGITTTTVVTTTTAPVAHAYVVQTPIYQAPQKSTLKKSEVKKVKAVAAVTVAPKHIAYKTYQSEGEVSESKLGASAFGSMNSMPGIFRILLTISLLGLTAVVFYMAFQVKEEESIEFAHAA